jgi:hypothetical protein
VFSLGDGDFCFFMFCFASMIPKFLKFERVENVAKNFQKLEKQKWEITKLDEVIILKL